MKYSLITTVLNEEKSILALLESIEIQTKLPDEIIIVDGGSQDKTINVIKHFQKSSNLKIKILIVKGNRSIGRNAAINHSSGDIILCTDAGCYLDKNWVKNISSPFSDKDIDVVAGFYKSNAKSIFEKCITPYVLVMEDRIDAKNFLPATRSIAFKKEIWEKAGKFDQKLSDNEDYAFARKLKKIEAYIYFAKNAIVYWRPRSNMRDSFIMFYRFAKGDVESGIIRPKVILIFMRYFIGLLLLTFCIYFGSFQLAILIFLFLSLYISWSFLKNYRYIKDLQAIYYLPLIQFISDIAVLLGSIKGFLTKLGNH